MKSVRRQFLTGLLAITPMTITGWILWRFYRIVDAALRPLLENVTYLRDQVPDFLVTFMGALVFLGLIVLIGTVTRTLIGVAFFGLFEKLLVRIPVIRGIFSVTKQISEVFLADNRRAFQKVVAFEYPRRGLYSVGFVTSDRPGASSVNVFLPTTPNPTSGYLLIVPRGELRELPITVEEGVRLVISGGSVVEAADAAALESLFTAPGRIGGGGGHE
jgi:uncharacterized membrane protein